MLVFPRLAHLLSVPFLIPVAQGGHAPPSSWDTSTAESPHQLWLHLLKNHSFTHQKIFIDTFYMPSTVLGFKDMAMNKTGKFPDFMEFTFS